MTRQRNDDGTRVTNWDDFWTANAGHKIADNYAPRMNKALPGSGDFAQGTANLAEGNFKKGTKDMVSSAKAPLKKLKDLFD